MRHRCRIVLFLFLAAFVPDPAFAQTTGDLDGTVADQNGGPLPGASVELRSPSLQGARTAVTDSAGRYRFPALAPGVYAVTAKVPGFASAERTGLKVSLGATTTAALQLAISVKESLVVTAEAPAIDTTRTTIGTNATLETMQRLSVARVSFGPWSQNVALTAYADLVANARAGVPDGTRRLN